MNRIKELRIEKGISQRELANLFNISQQTISTYENNTREPDTETLKRFAEYFNVSIDYILGMSNIKTTADKILGDNTETIAFHRSNGYDDDLPEEAIEEIEKFKEFIRHKYSKK